MRKGIKILVKVLSMIVLLSIFLPIAITLVLNVESVQNRIIERASRFASDYMGVTVAIDRIDLDLFSRVRVEGFYVEDHECDTLLYVRRARAGIGSLNIGKDGLVLNSAEAEGVKFFLRELSDGELNIRPVVDSLRKEGESRFVMHMDEAVARDVEFRYERLQHRNPEYGIDYYDMQIKDIDARVENFLVERGRVVMDVRELSGVERSGFTIEDIVTGLEVNRGLIAFTEFHATTQTSSIHLPSMRLEGRSWDQYEYYIDSVQMVGRMSNSTLSTEDLGYFAPALRTWNTSVRNATADFRGLVRHFEGVVHHADIAKESHFAGTFDIKGIPAWQTSKYVIGVEDLYLTSNDILALTDNILHEPLDGKVRDIVSRAKWVSARGTFGGYLHNFRVVGNVGSGEGGLSADIKMAKEDDVRHRLQGRVKTSRLDMGELLSLNVLHDIDSDIVVDGSFGSRDSGGVRGDVDVNVSGLGLGNYRYTAISGMGHIDGDSYYAELYADDPNMEFDLYANAELNEEMPTYMASLGLRRADLHALGINRRDSVSVLEANVGVELYGRDIEELSGNISIADIEYLYPQGELHSDRMRMEVESAEAHKSIGIDSDFFDISYQSHSTYREVYEYIYNSLMTYIPLLYDNAVELGTTSWERNDPRNYTALSIRANDDVNVFLDAIASGFVMAPDTKLDMTFNPRSNNITLRGTSEAVEYSGVIMANVDLNVNNSSVDSLSLRVKSEGVYLGSRLIMPNFNLHGGARENRVSLTAGFRESDNNSALLGMSARFSRNAETHRRAVHIDITPSHFTSSTQQWRLYSRGIDIDSTRISVKDLRIARPDQQLIINGVASRLRTDSIRLVLDNFNISPLTTITGRYGYDVSGVSNGYATVKSALNNPQIEAYIELADIDVNGIVAPPQQITSNWDFERNRARVIVSDRTTADTVLRGYYQPQGNRYWAQARMPRVDAAILSPVLKGIISDITGTADVEAQVQGIGRMAELNGRAIIDSLGMSVDYTKVRYTAPRGVVDIRKNHVLADRIEVYDPEGNKGYYSMDVSLERLANVTYDIDIDVEKMLVLDTKQRDNDLFYGHVYASGGASFRGDKTGIKMDIEGTSEDNSQFFMPLSGKEDIAYADFVKFREANIEAPDTTAFLTRRMMAYERKRRQISSSEGVMDMDISLNVQPNIEVQLVIDPTVGDIIKGRGSGQLAMHIVPKANLFEMRGDYTITEGTYLFTLQNILNKLFTVVPGSSIHWSGDPLGANLNIDAIYSTKASLRPLLGSSVQGIDVSRAVPVDCYIKLSDELMSPTVTFDVQVPNVAPEIQTVLQSALNDQQAIATQMFWLLAANTFSAEDTGSMGASLSATTGFELLSNQLSNWLSGENYNIVLRYRPRTELTGDEVDFGFSKSWLDNRVIVEFEGGYLSDASVQMRQNASNFVGEAFITWLIDADGTFRLRGFTQTIDRYGENQGMQESGVGLYYQESFNSFKDLGQSLRKRFTRKNKPATKERKRAHKGSKSNNAEVVALDIESDTLRYEDVTNRETN